MTWNCRKIRRTYLADGYFERSCHVQAGAGSGDEATHVVVLDRIQGSWTEEPLKSIFSLLKINDAE